MRKVLTIIMLTGLLTLGAFVSVAGAQDEYNPEVGGTVVTRGSDPGQLPFTGSTGTGTYVLVGVAIIALGGVLVVLGRRRDQLLNHS